MRAHVDHVSSQAAVILTSNTLDHVTTLEHVEVQESAASTSRHKAKAAKRKNGANKPLNDLAGLNHALQDLMPMIQSQAQAKSKASANAPKFKRSGARSHLQLQAQEDITAVLQAKEFQADPIKALTTHLHLAMGPPPSSRPSSKPISKRERKHKAQLNSAEHDMELP